MGEEQNKKFNLILYGTITLIILLTFGIIWYINRKKPFLNTVLWFVIALVILGIFTAIVFLVVWLLKKKKIDLLYETKKNVISSAEITKPDNKTEIVLYNNQNTIILGEYLGFTQIKSSSWIEFIDKKDLAKNQPFRNLTEYKSKDKTGIKEEFVYLISFKTRSNKNEVLLAVREDFNDLNSNPIIVYGEGLSPKIYEMHFLSKYYDMADKVEMPIKTLLQKYTIEHMMRDQISIIDNAIDLDADFRKDQEKSNLDDFKPKADRQ